MYLTFTEPGLFLGLTGSRLMVHKDKSVIKEFPLSKIKLITVESKGISFSGDLLMSCSERGIQFFVTNFKGDAVTSLYGLHHHATSKVRDNQFEFIKGDSAIVLCKDIVSAKIRNQRSVLLYFSKYLNKKDETANCDLIKDKCDSLLSISKKLLSEDILDKSTILGYEGSAARIYWQTLKKSGLLTPTFSEREGRGSREINNIMLNYGYAILSSHIWRALQNAGLELYAGVLHDERSGKPSLVLDLMEIFRAWVVDRAVVKLSGQYNDFSYACKRSLINDINQMMDRKYALNGKKVRLEAIIQRQAYRLAGVFAGDSKYKPYLFKW